MSGGDDEVEDGGAQPVQPVSFGRYELIASLGRGGMAEVYLAMARGPVGFQKLVVIKRLRPDVEGRPGFRMMFLDEARLAARLNHPNVVQTHEVVEDRESFFLAMEYLDGQPLHRVIRAAIQAGKPLGPVLGSRIVADALLGLHYSHELRDYDGAPLGIVHRDVSPQNVFVTYDGQVKLVDFGIAKAEVSAAETEVGIVKGKVAYMAPEQILEKPIDRRADVFSMGIVLWELLTETRLMLRDSAAATLHRVVSEPSVPPSTIVPGLPRELDAITMRALERRPEDRFDTAGEMRSALLAYLGKQPAAHDELSQRMTALFARHRQAIDRRIQQCMRSTEAGLAKALPSLPSETPRPVPPAPPSDMVETVTLPSLDLEPASSTTNALNESARTGGGSVARSVVPETTPAPSGRGAWIVAAVASCAAAAAVALVVRGRAAPSGGAAAVTPALPAKAEQPETILRLHGSNTIGAELAPLLADAYLRRIGGQVTREVGPREHEVRVVSRRDGARAMAVEIDAEGSSTAFSDLGTGACDIGMSSRAIKPDEAAALQTAGLGDLSSPASEHVLGLDGIAVVVHPNNAIRQLSTAQLRAVFTGQAKDWSELGGTAGPVTLYARDGHSGTYDTFKHLVLGDADVTPQARRYVESDKLSDSVAGDPAGIGFIGLAYVRTAKAVAVSDQKSAALFPSTFTVATEDYALSRRLYLYTPVNPKNARTLEFVNFALSQDGQTVVKNAGFVDLGVSLRDGETCGDGCPKRYLLATRRARRLSVDFRFRSGSTDLDSRALRDVDRLLAFLRPHAGAKIALLGFSDSSGDATQNLELSRVRARKVDEELGARGIHASTEEGLGAEMPVASNATEAGRQKNRRVEVWLSED